MLHLHSAVVGGGAIDARCLEPVMEALVFLGRDLFADTPGFYFQDLASYISGIRHDASNATDGQYTCQPSGQVSVMDFERALDRLLDCSLRRADERPRNL